MALRWGNPQSQLLNLVSIVHNTSNEINPINATNGGIISTPIVEGKMFSSHTINTISHVAQGTPCKSQQQPIKSTELLTTDTLFVNNTTPMLPKKINTPLPFLNW